MEAILINILIQVAIALATTLVAQMFSQDQNNVQGIRGQIQIGGDNSPSFIIGRYGTAGKLKYAGTWGQDGKVPNAYFSKVVEVSFLPIRGFSGFFVDGQRVTLAPTKTGDLGYAVLEYRVDAKDHLWINPYTGSQTVADPLMVAKFGSDPDRPYTSDMVGRGLGYFVATALINRDLFSGRPDFMAEVDGITLDDPRGDGNNDNPIVAAYTILKGLRYAGQWVYGPQNVTANNFRAANLESEADKCDALIPLSGGGTMPRFRMGLEVSLDTEPHAVVGELLKACEGRWADVGGVYKFLVSTPNAAIASFTDEDIVITEQQTYEPFPGLESLFNAMTATYPEPAEAWEMKEAPPRYRSDLEVKDDNRRLPFSTEYKAVPYAVQVQKLMRAAIEETRRFRRHTFTAPPEWWEYEVLDTVSWTSDRNGYDGKSFLLTTMDDLPNANQFVGLQEIDPADYDWSSSNQLPYSVTPLVTIRPPAQPVSGAYVEPIVIEDSEGRGRRPGIGVHWDGDMPDLRAVRITVRLASSHIVVWEGENPKPIGGYAPIAQNLVNATEYEVQLEYQPFSGRRTTPTSWLPVTTPDIRLSIYDIDDELGLLTGILDGAGGLNERFEVVRDRLAQLAAAGTSMGTTLRRDLDAASAEFIEQISVVVNENQALVDLTTLLRSDFNANVAFVGTQLTALSDADSAQAALIDEVAVEVDGVSAGGLFKMEASAGPTGWQTSIAAIVRASAGGTDYEAGWYTYIKSTGETAFVVKANNFYVLNNTGGEVTAPFRIVGGVVYIKQAVIEDLSIGTEKVAPRAATDITVGYQTVDRYPYQNVIAQTVPVEDDPNVTGVTIQFVAFMDRPDLDAGNVGYWRMVLKRNGTQIDQTPDLFYDDNFAYPAVAIWHDPSPGEDPAYLIAAELISGPGNFLIKDGIATFTLHKR